MAFVHDHIQPTVHLGADGEVDLRVDMRLDGAVKAVPVGEAQVVGADDLYAFGGEVGVDVGGLAGTRQAAGKVECLHGGCILFYNVGNGESGEGDGDVPHDVGEVGGVVAGPLRTLPSSRLTGFPSGPSFDMFEAWTRRKASLTSMPILAAVQ